VVPWWVGPPVGAGLYALIAWRLPAVSSDGAYSFIPALAKVAAPWVAFLTLGMWVASLAFKWRRRELLDQQRGLESICAMSWQDFEKLVGEVYRRQGYMVAEHGGPQPDNCTDLSLRRDGHRKIVQCKHWKKQKVGLPVVREVYGEMVSQSANGAVIVTTGQFTRETQDWAKGKPLELINGARLWEMVETQRARAADAAGREAAPQVASTEGDQEQAPAGSDAVAPGCPRCGGPTLLKTARKGVNIGRQFYGCQAFPRCRGTVDVPDGTA